MTALEKAARAACIADGHDPDVTCDVFTGDPADSFAWGGYRNIARAVLLAVREPDGATVVEVAKPMLDEGAPFNPVPGVFFTAMIDTILSPTDGGER
jgi:hypothetical protein